ncbi:MAG: CoA-acylating methylmalonate-semialdehyde dehydrogenase, partial [Acidimicrobiales bacterium]
LKVLLEQNAEKVCQLITDEHGKVLADAMGELQRGIENVEYASYAPELLKGEHSRNVGPGIDSWSEFQPLGVTAGITPFNFPAMVPLWMWPMAVACGNSFVLKPSERDPSSALLIAELALQAGLPPGVLNVVHGDKEAVDTLLTDARVKAVSFVGSTPIAEDVYATGTAHGKRVQALGGAKNHAVVMPDADIDNAVAALMGAAFGSCGERCMAISVLTSVGSIADTVIDAIADRLPKLRIGAGTDPDSDMGPLVTREHRDKVASYLDSGPAQGATLVADGRDAAPDGNGFFLGVSLLDNVTTEMDAYKDEIFGPVLGITRVETYDEAVRMVNENPYGNGTAIFTRDGGGARQFEFDVQAGMVGINVPIPVPVAYYSFGGWKQSLFGDRHIYGPE